MSNVKLVAMATYCCSYHWLQGGLLGPYYAQLYSWCTVRPYRRTPGHLQYCLKDEVHTTDIIKYAIQVKALSERDRFTVIVDNSFTKQHKYHLLNKLQYDQKTIWPPIQDGGHFNMADISKWRTFNKETNMVGISILQIFQSEERYLNTAIRIATPHY